MIMKIIGFDLEIDINQDGTNLLVVNDYKLFGKVCYDLNQINQDNIVFINNDKIINIKDIIIFSDILSFNFNDKSIITKLYNKLFKDIISNSEIDNELKDNFMNISKILYDEIENYNIDINLKEDIDLIKYFKLVRIEFENEYRSLFDKFIDILEVYSELYDQTLIFINALSYFTNEEINEILK